VATRRVEVGFEGGTVLRLTIPEAEVDALTGSLGSGGWKSLEADEGGIWLNVGELVYVRVVPGEAAGRIGFRE
jgi:hypothetical protein